MVGLAIAGVYEHPYALVSFGLCMFVTATIFSEFLKGATAISAKSGIGLIPAMIELTHRNTRRYGGYMVHMGIVFMFIGFTGAAFNKDVTKEVAPGGTFSTGALHAADRRYVEGRERQLRLAEADGGGSRAGSRWGRWNRSSAYTNPASSRLRRLRSAGG